MEPNSLADIEQWIASHPLSLLAFTTSDCGVCDALRPRIAELESEIGLLSVRYVDVSGSPEVAGQFGIFAVPVYVLSVQGREAMRFARYFSMDELRSAVERYSALIGGS